MSALDLHQVCRHAPGDTNTFCDDCGALVLAGVLLRSPRCGHERRLPPGFTWTPRSWCPLCEAFQPFGHPSTAVKPARAPFVSPFWSSTFATQARRPLSVAEVGRSLGYPNVRELSRRVGMRWDRNWYRWRDSGLDVFTADTIAINASLHPIDVWGVDWEAA